METLEERIKRVVQEDVAIVAYNPVWPGMFEQEKNHLLRCLPAEWKVAAHPRGRPVVMPEKEGFSDGRE